MAGYASAGTVAGNRPSTSNVAEEEGNASKGCGGAYVRSFGAHREGSDILKERVPSGIIVK